MYTPFAWVTGDIITAARLLAIETQFAEATEENAASASIVAGVLTLDLNAAKYFYVSLNANVTSIVLSNLAASGRIETITIEFIADGTLRTVVWPSGTVWSYGAVPIMTATVNKKDLVTLMSRSGGTPYLAFISQNH